MNQEYEFGMGLQAERNTFRTLPSFYCFVSHHPLGLFLGLLFGNPSKMGLKMGLAPRGLNRLNV